MSNVNEELLKTLNGAIDAAVKELISIDSLSKGDTSLQDAKLRPESANGSLPGDNRGDSALKPEDAKKAEQEDAADKANKGENPFADKDKDGKDDKEEAKEGKKDKDKDDSEDDDLDDDKAEKMKAKLKKWEDDKAAKAQSATMSKSEMAATAETMQKSIVASVTEAMEKSFSERLTQLEGMIKTIAGAPQPRQSKSGLAPLAKSDEDVAGTAAQETSLTKGQMLDQLFGLQKNDDKRVDSTVINRVEMGDYSVLAERGINLK